MKPIRAVILMIMLCCLCETADGLPVPVKNYPSLLRSDERSNLYPGSELTWKSWLTSSFYLTADTISNTLYQEFAGMPNNALSMLTLAFVSKIPDYIALTMLEVGVLRGYARINAPVRTFFNLSSLWLAWSAALAADKNTTKPPDFIQFDSTLLNSLFRLKIIDSDQLLMTLSPWPHTLELLEGSSPLVRTLVNLHQTLTARNIHQCVLDSGGEDDRIIYVCDQGHLQLTGMLELDTDCISFSWESVRPEHHACQFSKLQTSILNCFTAAVSQQGHSNIPFRVQECEPSSPLPSRVQDDLSLITLSEIEEGEEASDFLVVQGNENLARHFIFTGAMKAIQSTDSALQAMALPENLQPAVGIRWQDQWKPAVDGTRMGFRLAWMKAIRAAHDRVFLPLAYQRFKLKYPNNPARQGPYSIAGEKPALEEMPSPHETGNSPLAITESEAVVSSDSESTSDFSSTVSTGSEASLGVPVPEKKPALPPVTPVITVNDEATDSSSDNNDQSLQSIDEIPQESYLRRGSAPAETIQPYLTKPPKSLFERRMSASSGGGGKQRGTHTPPTRLSSLMLPLHQQRRRSLPGHMTLRDVAHMIRASSKFKGSQHSPTVLNRPDTILSHPGQGMDPGHFIIAGKIARLLGMPIFFRPINPENIDLIPLLLPTKDLRIKPKTADSNFAKGLMPANPAFSKLAGDIAAINKAIQTLKKLIARYPNLITTKPLILPDARMKKLLSQAVDANYTPNPPQYTVTFEKRGIQWQQIARKQIETDKWEILLEDGTPFEVVAHPTLGYYIADYDPLIMAPPYSHHIIINTLTGNASPHYSVIITRVYAREADGTPVPSFYRTSLHVMEKAPVSSLLAETQSEITEGIDPETGRAIYVTRDTTLIPRKEYLQNQWFKPLDLGDYDRVQLPVVNPEEVLRKLLPGIIDFFDEQLDVMDERIAGALDTVSSDNARIFRSVTLQQLLSIYHPESGLHTTLMLTSNQNLVELWAAEFPSVMEPVPTELYHRKNTELYHLERVRSYLILVEGLPDYLDGMDPLLGNISPRMQQTGKMINQAFDRGTGLGMIHHGCDSGNPYSGINDLCPATGLMPLSMSSYNKEVLIAKLEGINQLVTTMKSHGFYVPLNPNWHLDLSLRSKRFDWARENILNWYMGERITEKMLEADPVRYEIIIEPMDCLDDPGFLEHFKQTLPRYLYEPFTAGSPAMREWEINGCIKVIFNSNPAQDIAN